MSVLLNITCIYGNKIPHIQLPQLPPITPMKDKCEAIRCFDPPKTVQDCRTFCGMVNFLATFLKDLQKILIPIYNLTRKCIKQQEQPYINIKAQLSILWDIILRNSQKQYKITLLQNSNFLD